MFGFLAFRRFRCVGPVALGTALSASIEMTQLYTPGRNCSTVDLATNFAGSFLGVALGLVWIAAMLFPIFPETSLPNLGHKLGVFAHGAWLSPVPLISAAALWSAAASMMRRPMWLVAMLPIIPGQIFMVTRQPLPVQLLGACIGVAVFRFIDRRILGWCFLAVVALRGLAPFHLSPEAHSFQWTPFIGLLNTEWQYGIQVLLEKLFWYGAAIWLLRHAGLRWWRAIGVVALVLLAIEFAQTRLPGHVPEITDPLLACIVGLAIMRIHDQSSIRPDAGRPQIQSHGTV
jgi:VanZ family protein